MSCGMDKECAINDSTSRYLPHPAVWDETKTVPYETVQHRPDIAGGFAPVAGHHLVEAGKLRMPGAVEPEMVSGSDGGEKFDDDIA